MDLDFPKSQPPLSAFLEHQHNLLEGEVSTLMCSFALCIARGSCKFGFRFVTMHEMLLLGPAVYRESSARLWCSSVGNECKQ